MIQIHGKQMPVIYNKNSDDSLLCRKTVYDELMQQDVVLSEEDLEVIKRLQEGRIPDVNYDPYEVSSIETELSYVNCDA
jgi:hypothetical protein